MTGAIVGMFGVLLAMVGTTLGLTIRLIRRIDGITEKVEALYGRFPERDL